MGTVKKNSSKAHLLFLRFPVHSPCHKALLGCSGAVCQVLHTFLPFPSCYWWHNLHRSWGERLTWRLHLLRVGKSIFIIQKYRTAGTQTSCSRSLESREGVPLRQTYAWNKSQYSLHTARVIRDVGNEDIGHGTLLCRFSIPQQITDGVGCHYCMMIIGGDLRQSHL